jgi:hypothetical protein
MVKYNKLQNQNKNSDAKNQVAKTARTIFF